MMMDRDNEELLLLVGRLNYTWTNTESLLIHIIQLLMRTSKEASVLVFLTLNTSRARFDLVERLAKMDSVEHDDRTFCLQIISRMKRASAIRNKYNHCIYGFDGKGHIATTQLMRIADFGKTLRYGKLDVIDDNERIRLKDAISEVVKVNHEIISHLNKHHIALQ